MKSITLAGLGLAVALSGAPPAVADPTPGHYAIIRTSTPNMTCMVGSDDDTPGRGPNVLCQGERRQGFPGSPIDPDSTMHLHSAVITAAGKLSYLDGNIGEGGDDFNPTTLPRGNDLHVQGWTITSTGDDVTFTNDATGHGMTVSHDQNVETF